MGDKSLGDQRRCRFEPPLRMPSIYLEVGLSSVSDRHSIQNRERTWVPGAAAALGWWMRPDPQLNEAIEPLTSEL